MTTKRIVEMPVFLIGFREEKYYRFGSTRVLEVVGRTHPAIMLDAENSRLTYTEFVEIAQRYLKCRLVLEVDYPGPSAHVDDPAFSEFPQ